MRIKNDDDKIFRIIAILKKLDAREKVTTRYLAEEFNVTVRTIQRDINLLNITGFPIFSDERGHYSFVESFSLANITTSKEEASLFSLLNEISHSLGKDFEESFKSILGKVASCHPETPFYIKIPAGEKLEGQGAFVEKLKRAITGRKRIELEYLRKDGEKQSFKVEPLKITFYEGFWYLFASFEGSSSFHKFAMDRIKEVRVLNEKFKFPENLQMILDESINIWSSSKRDKKATLSVTKKAAQYFRKRAYFPLQKIVKEKKDGSLIIETMLAHPMEGISVVLQWIPHVKVISPKSIRDEVKKMIEGYLKIL